jgi:hypothetical protein
MATRDDWAKKRVRASGSSGAARGTHRSGVLCSSASVAKMRPSAEKCPRGRSAKKCRACCQGAPTKGMQEGAQDGRVRSWGCAPGDRVRADGCGSDRKSGPPGGSDHQRQVCVKELCLLRGPSPARLQQVRAVCQQSLDQREKGAARSSCGQPGGAGCALSNEESCGEYQTCLADSGADDDTKARLLGGVCRRAQVDKSRPDGTNGVHLLKESASQVWGEWKRVAGRVSTGRGSHGIGRSI